MANLLRKNVTLDVIMWMCMCYFYFHSLVQKLFALVAKVICLDVKSKPLSDSLDLHLRLFSSLHFSSSLEHNGVSLNALRHYWLNRNENLLAEIDVCGQHNWFRKRRRHNYYHSNCGGESNFLFLSILAVPFPFHLVSLQTNKNHTKHFMMSLGLVIG